MKIISVFRQSKGYYYTLYLLNSLKTNIEIFEKYFLGDLFEHLFDQQFVI